MTQPGHLALYGGNAVRQRFLPFHQPSLSLEEEQAVVETLRSGWVTTGPKTKEFELEVADYVGADHAVGLNSCTAALHLALEVVGVGEGDEVITSPTTFAATANVIVHRRARPVFVDVEPETLNLDPSLIEAACSSRTRAILPVHFAGHPCEMDEIRAVARRLNLSIVEDAAHALGASYRGAKIGGGDAVSAFSFYATKNITTGEGGMLTLKDKELADRVRVLGLHGISRDAWKRYGLEGYAHWDIIEAGYKYNMFDLQAALGLHQLKKLDGFMARRREIYQRYLGALSSMDTVDYLEIRAHVDHAYHLFVIMIRPEALSADRDTIMNAIQAENVGIGIHFRAVHLHPYYRKNFGFSPGLCPVAERASDRVISIPFHPALTDHDVEDVIATVRKVLNAFKR